MAKMTDKPGPKTIIGKYDDGEVATLKITRTIIWNGKIAPGVTGFVPKGDGIVTCMICGKDLPDPLSAARTIGPECIKRWGPMHGKEYIEAHAKAFKSYQRKIIKAGMAVKSFKDWAVENGISLPQGAN